MISNPTFKKYAIFFTIFSKCIMLMKIAVFLQVWAITENEIDRRKKEKQNICRLLVSLLWCNFINMTIKRWVWLYGCKFLQWLSLLYLSRFAINCWYFRICKNFITILGRIFKIELLYTSLLIWNRTVAKINHQHYASAIADKKNYTC
jgi:hypothetical protein